MATPLKSKSLGGLFGLQRAPTALCAPLVLAKMEIARIRRGPERAAQAVLMPPEDAYLMVLYLTDGEYRDNHLGKPDGPTRFYTAGTVCLVNLKDGPGIRLTGALDVLAIRMPRAIFDEITDRLAIPRMEDLLCLRGEPDEVLHHLGVVLLSLFENVRSPLSAAFRHVALAVILHVLDYYGDTKLRRAPDGLKLKSSSRSNDFRHDDLAEARRNRDLKDKHDLPRYSAVRRKQMVSRAEQLLQTAEFDLADVARFCGLGTKLDLIQAFLDVHGMTPAGWRRWGSGSDS